MFRDSKKPTERTIIINGDIYVKEPDKDFLFVSIFVNRYKQRRVTIEWNEFYKQWFIELVNGFRSVDSLSEPIWLEDKRIPVYLNEEQIAGLDKIITETILKVDK